jgi:hypothetical protein
LLSAWLPQFKIFIIGTGRTFPFPLPKYSKICLFSEFEQATTNAIETHKIAFAQRLLLFFVQSSFSKASSSSL